MPRPRDELTAGEWAALALLAEGSTHGFAIARAMAPEGEVGKIWTVRRPLVYRALETLTGMGLARAGGTVVGMMPRFTGAAGFAGAVALLGGR